MEHLVLTLSCMCRFKWQSGRAFNGIYDAAPTTDADFVRVENGQLMKGCSR